MSKDRYWYEKLVNSDCSGKFAPKGHYNNHTKGIRGKNKKETQCKNNTIQHEKFLQDALFGQGAVSWNGPIPANGLIWLDEVLAPQNVGKPKKDYKWALKAED